ncbi:acyltransferase [Roseateles sp. BYS180W]|uniref:Acyltransferase n=1 Tax=Roseateles rivi TaxID=3299028 RepID=A0ABW7FS63_9BURK
MRSHFNRWRRAVWQALAYRMVFGERDGPRGVRPHTRIAPSTCIQGAQGLRLADHVFIGQFNFLDAQGGLTLHEGVQITNFVSVLTHSSHRSVRLLGRHYVQHPQPLPGYVSAPVEIGAYSFIGPHSLIEPGARLGRGVVVCAYAQVRGEVPDFAIVAGQPARVVGDVRTRDAELLRQHPELAEHYRAWAGELPQGAP